MKPDIRVRWFKPSYGGLKGPANWKGWLTMVAFVTALTCQAVAAFGIGLGRTLPWPEFIAWIAGSVIVTVFYELVVHLTSGDP